MMISDRQYMYMLRYNQFSIFIMIIISISDLIILGYKYTMEERLHANIDYFAHELMVSFPNL
jgi:hypothetical protein